MTTTAADSGLDLRQLVVDLLNRVDGEVRFDAGTRALYSTDASNYRLVPKGAVIPRSIDGLVAAVETCRDHGAPIMARGAGTGLAGQSCNDVVVIDCSKYLRKIVDIDPDRRLARVQPGVPLDALRHEAQRYGLTFGPDPATHEYCTLGGMIGNNSCGIHSVMAGRTIDNVESLEILTYDGVRMQLGKTSDEAYEQAVRSGGRVGEIQQRLRRIRDRYGDLVRERFPDIPRRVSGYPLDELLPERGFNLARAVVGTESTCITLLDATVRLVDWPSHRSLLVIGYPDVYRAADDVPRIRASGVIGLEGLDAGLRDDAAQKGLHRDKLELLPEAGGWLLAEFGGSSAAEASDAAERLLDELQGEPGVSVRQYDDPRQQASVFEVRESGLGATAKVPGDPDTWPGWEDSAVPPERLGDYLRDLRRLLEEHGYENVDFYGHFGDGCLHTRIPFDLRTSDGIRAYRSFIEAAADLVVAYGGSFSGEHGDGQARGELLPRLYGDELVEAFREFKYAWDPAGKMNPGKVVDARPLDADLHLDSSWRIPVVASEFHYGEEHGFADATDRCVGVGKCRRTESGLMCPSYQVTREEKDSTRGRARALFEMVRGDVVTDGWRSEEVFDALDLCLSCKGCAAECPVSVDMATYKAEFLSHYYEGRLRPRTAYAFGLIMYWARLASVAPGLANVVTSAPGLRWVAKRVTGMAPQRSVPRFARQTFRRWWKGRSSSSRPTTTDDLMRVILWPDTFNDHFHPQTARAAVRVLEAAGAEVIVPDRNLCCGRPLYEFGMVARARGMLQAILDELREDIRAGTPVVFLEPSCASVLRHELLQLFADDPDAERLASQSLLLSEFLAQIDYDPPPMRMPALVQGHCHHRSVLDFDAEEEMLSRIGLRPHIPDTGCCGMAGSFGFEAGERYEVGIGAGERVLLPAVREADPETLILADGYSCREQIAQETDRRALHLAEVLALALDGGAGHARRPEDLVPEEPATARDAVAPAVIAAAFLAATAGAVRAFRR